MQKIKSEILTATEEKSSLMQKIKDEALSASRLEADELQRTITERKAELVELDEKILLQSFALYQPIYNFATSIEYKDAGIILKYTPRVNADGSITATIHTEVSTPQYVSDLKAYRFNTRSADTTVTVRDGEPMVIGGLIGAEESKSLSKIPFLGDLPILGALFRNHKSGKSESELMIFLTAHVLNGAN